MRWIKLYEEFNEGILPFKNKKLTLEETVDLIKKECTMFLDIMKKEDDHKKRLIFRKFKENIEGDTYLVHPKESPYQRISPYNIKNYHNLILSNLESWKDYPRRNKSLITAGINRSRNHTGSYFKVVVPFDKTKIGMVKVPEFWDSFKEKNILLDDYINNIIDDICYKNGLEYPSDRNWEELKKFLLDHNLLDRFNKELKPNDKFVLGHFDKISQEVYDFRVKNYAGAEAWMEDECLLLDYNLVFKSSEYNDSLLSVCKSFINLFK
jgi:hypothetical protein